MYAGFEGELVYLEKQFNACLIEENWKKVLQDMHQNPRILLLQSCR